jgi:CRP-like cAMP-binding protein
MSEKEKLRKLKDRASKAFGDGKLKDAIKLYQQAVEEDPTELACQIKIGDIYRRLGQRPQAVAAYEPVARHYAEDGMLLKAIAVCKLILTVDAAHTATQEMLADLYSKRATPGRVSTADLPPLKPPPGKRQGGAIELNIDEEDSEPMVVERTVPSTPQVVVGHKVAPEAPPVIVGSKVDGPPVIVGTKSQPAPKAVGFAWPVSAGASESSEPAIEVEIGDVEPAAAPAPPPAPPASVPALGSRVGEAAPPLDPSRSGPADHRPLIVADASGSLESEFEIIDEPSQTPIELHKVARPESPRADDLGQPQIPLFSDLPKNAFIEILVRMKMREMAPGDFVIKEGETGNSFFVLAQGKVRIARKSPEGGETVLAYLTDGAFFGEMALLQDGARTASVIVEEDSQVFEISRAVLDEVVATYPSVAKVLRNFYTQRLLSTTMATHPLFKSFGAKERRDLMELFKSRSFNKGEVLVQEGKKGEGLYLILTGTLEVSKEKDGQPIVIAELDAGDMFGEMSLLTNKPTVATVVATSDCFILRLAKKDFDEVIMTYPQVLELVSQVSEERATENSAIFGAWTPRSEEGAALV